MDKKKNSTQNNNANNNTNNNRAEFANNLDTQDCNTTNKNKNNK